MPRPKGTELTDREAQILEVLWRLEAATAEDVRAHLPGEPHDSTVRTLLRVMEQKGLVTHVVEERKFVYRAQVAQNKAQRKAVRGLVQRLFGGSVRSLVLQLIDDEEITPEELERLARECQTEPDSGPHSRRGKR